MMEAEIYGPGLSVARGLVADSQEVGNCDLKKRIICYAKSDAGLSV